MTTRPLAGVDAQVFDLLVRICRIGEHRKAWDARTVARVAAHHLPPLDSPDPSIETHKARIYALQRELDRLGHENDQLREINRRLNARLYPLAHDGHQVAHISPRRAEALNLAAKAVPREQIAEHLQTSRHAVDIALSRAAQDIGASGTEHAIALVAGGQVEVRASVTKRGRMAA